jgi:hypothetical protein
MSIDNSPEPPEPPTPPPQAVNINMDKDKTIQMLNFNAFI